MLLIVQGANVETTVLKELAKLKNLKVVGLIGTQTTEAGVKELRAALPKLSR